MVDMKDCIESEYVSVEFVKNLKDKVGKIVSGGAMQDTDWGKRLSFAVDIDGHIKTWRPNRDSIKNLVESYGSQSDSCSGKMIKFQIVMINGKEAVLGIPLQ